MPLMKSWVASANAPDTPFPLNNLPYGVFSTEDRPGKRCGVAIGDEVLDLIDLAGNHSFADVLGANGQAIATALEHADWTAFMALGPEAWQALRTFLQTNLAEDNSSPGLEMSLIPMASVTLHMPFRVTEYTDFYAGRHHAENVGTMFRGRENTLPPNWLHIPIGYNGRASSVVVSGTDIVRPNGQTVPAGSNVPEFGPCKRLDFELEMGAIVGTPSEMGRPISVAEADAMIFGYVLLNDWSARDIQTWEYQPLGPFQAKAFATTISPWIVTAAALEPFRRSTPERDMPLLPYLEEPGPMLFDIDLAVTLQPENGRETTIARTNYTHMYYSAAQQLAHHASSGCPMSVGDLLGSGTISGPGASQRGSLLELTWGGKEPLELDGDATRGFIEDGDTVTLQGAAKGDGYQIGFGTCTGTVIPAPRFPR